MYHLKSYSLNLVLDLGGFNRGFSASKALSSVTDSRIDYTTNFKVHTVTERRLSESQRDGQPHTSQKENFSRN